FREFRLNDASHIFESVQPFPYKIWFVWIHKIYTHSGTPPISMIACLLACSIFRFSRSNSDGLLASTLPKWLCCSTDIFPCGPFGFFLSGSDNGVTVVFPLPTFNSSGPASPTTACPLIKWPPLAKYGIFPMLKVFPPHLGLLF